MCNHYFVTDFFNLILEHQIYLPLTSSLCLHEAHHFLLFKSILLCGCKPFQSLLLIIFIVLFTLRHFKKFKNSISFRIFVLLNFFLEVVIFTFDLLQFTLNTSMLLLHLSILLISFISRFLKVKLFFSESFTLSHYFF